MLIPLGACGLTTQVDDSDRHLVESSTWYANRIGNTWYAYRRVAGVNQSLHKILTGFPMTDHVNGDGLDNRRANLRAATRVQNGRNMRKSRGSSRYKGVCWSKERSLWQVNISTGEKRFMLGRYAEEEHAARIYDDAARSLFGEFAALNFPRPGEVSALRDKDVPA
jgi:hypothetical protein